MVCPRAARGLSQEALAYRAGTAYGTINRLELAQSAPAWATVRAIADALDITLSGRSLKLQEFKRGSSVVLNGGVDRLRVGTGLASAGPATGESESIPSGGGSRFHPASFPQR